MLWYAGLGVCQSVVCFFKELMLFLACANASHTIHQNLLSHTMHSPMSFFDTNPTGRILNRFSSDIDTVDQSIPFEIDDFMNCMAETVAILVIISYSTPLFTTVILPLAVLYLLIQKYLAETSGQDLKVPNILPLHRNRYWSPFDSSFQCHT